MTYDDLWRKTAENAIRYRNAIAEPRRTVGPREMFEAFREPLPETESHPGAVIDLLVARAEPGLRAMTGPRFFGWVIGASHPVGVAADWLTSAWGQNAGNHFAAPAAAAAEAVAAGWLLELLDLPRASSVGFATWHQSAEAPPTANVYEIPCRVLIPRELDNVLVAGRAVSATHEALGAIRVMPPCFAMGEAAGTAAGMMRRWRLHSQSRCGRCQASCGQGACLGEHETG